MNILFITAMEKEADSIIKYYCLEKEGNLYKKNNISLLITGVSRNSVVSTLLEEINNIDYNNTVIINVGLVGSNNLTVGDIVMVDKSYGYHFDLTPFGDPLYHSTNSPYSLNKIDDITLVDCYTSDAFVLKTDIKETVVFDMELNAIIPFSKNKLYSVKIVSDTLCSNKYNEFKFDESFNKVFYILDEIIKKIN